MISAFHLASGLSILETCDVLDALSRGYHLTHPEREKIQSAIVSIKDRYYNNKPNPTEEELTKFKDGFIPTAIKMYHARTNMSLGDADEKLRRSSIEKK